MPLSHVDVVAERSAEVAKDQRILSILYDSVEYFKMKMKQNMDELKEVIEELKGGFSMEREVWQVEVEESLEAFDDVAYLNGYSLC